MMNTCDASSDAMRKAEHRARQLFQKYDPKESTPRPDAKGGHALGLVGANKNNILSARSEMWCE
jgi:hypothetical protein